MSALAGRATTLDRAFDRPGGHGDMRARKRTTAVLAALMVVTALAACKPTPDHDSFYTPPASLPAANGTLIRSRSSVFTADPKNYTPVPGTKAWQMLYRST